MISDEPQAKDEPTVGEIWEAEQKITCRVNTKQEEKEKTIALPFGQPFCPFQDSDLNQCWKITPQDLVHFPRRQCALRNNRFLQYGYYNFRTSPSVPQIKWPVHTWCTRKLRPAGTVYGRHVRLSCFKESNCIKVKKAGEGTGTVRLIQPAGC